MRPLVLLTDVTDLDPRPAVEQLEEAGYRVQVLDLATRRDVPDDAVTAVAALVGFARIDAEILDRLPVLRVLATASAGTDMIDAEAARARGIEVIPLAGAATQEVASHALLLMLAAVRGLPGAQQTVREGGWLAQHAHVPRATEELTVGLLGYGRIARAVAARAAVVFGRVIAHDPYAEIALPATRVGIDELFAESDILSLHLPATPDTTGIVSAERLAAMPRGGILVNVSRAELVDEHAVLAALDEGALAAYAADVLAAEPPPARHPLREHPSAIITPHIAYRSGRSLDRYLRQPAQNIIDRLDTLKGRK